MKKIFSLTLLTLSSLISFGQNIHGNWNGILDVQSMQLSLVFHIEQKGDMITATMDSPDQKAFGIPVESATFKSNKLQLEMPNFKISYHGVPNADFSVIEGTFIQGGMQFPLKLSKKQIEKIKPNRPQTPKAPFLYEEEEVVFENKIDNIQLAGTLTLPKSKSKFPVVILISGSGPQDRNETLFDHQPFAVLADDLTKNGIAVLRFDDRGVGKSKGSFENSTTADFANDVRAAVEYLKTRKDINHKRIGLVGHSEGGMIAPMVANGNKDISFIVLMAGPGTMIDELLIDQSAQLARLSGMDNAVIEANSEMQKEIYRLIKNNKSDNHDLLNNELRTFLKKAFSSLPESMKPSTDEELNAAIDAQIQAVDSKWFQYFIKYNPNEILSKVKCPVLAINGSLDFQVPAKSNLKAIENALITAKNKDYKIVEIPKLNHLFQEANTGAFEEYNKIEQTISPIALQTIKDWILLKVK